jgi:hypothetical protein
MDTMSMISSIVGHQTDDIVMLTLVGVLKFCAFRWTILFRYCVFRCYTSSTEKGYVGRMLAL